MTWHGILRRLEAGFRSCSDHAVELSDTIEQFIALVGIPAVCLKRHEDHMPRNVWLTFYATQTLRLPCLPYN